MSLKSYSRYYRRITVLKLKAIISHPNENVTLAWDFKSYQDILEAS